MTGRYEWNDPRVNAGSQPDQQDEAITDDSVQPATSELTDLVPGPGYSTGSEWPNTSDATPTSEPSGSAITENELAGTTQISRRSGAPSKVLSRPWRRPRNAKALAAQVNTVMTQVLNGEIDPDTARIYSGLGRTLAQVLSAEVYQARFGGRAADLSLEERDEESEVS